MEIIKSNQNKQIKFLRSLKLKKYRLKNRQYLVEGFHLVESAKKHNLLQQVILTSNTNFDFSSKLIVSKDIIKTLSTTKTPQPILGLVSFKKEVDFDKNTNTLILDNLQEPGNLGSLLRSANAFGFKNIILSNECVDLYNSKVLRATQGAYLSLNIKKGNISDLISEIEGKIYCTKLDEKAYKLDEIKNTNRPISLVVGNEGNGISKQVFNYCTSNVIVDINDSLDSLNVVIAAAIIMNKFKK